MKIEMKKRTAHEDGHERMKKNDKMKKDNGHAKHQQHQDENEIGSPVIGWQRILQGWTWYDLILSTATLSGLAFFFFFFSGVSLGTRMLCK